MEIIQTTEIFYYLSRPEPEIARWTIWKQYAGKKEIETLEPLYYQKAIL